VSATLYIYNIRKNTNNIPAVPLKSHSLQNTQLRYLEAVIVCELGTRVAYGVPHGRGVGLNHTLTQVAATGEYNQSCSVNTQ